MLKEDEEGDVSTRGVDVVDEGWKQRRGKERRRPREPQTYSSRAARRDGMLAPMTVMAGAARLCSSVAL